VHDVSLALDDVGILPESLANLQVLAFDHSLRVSDLGTDLRVVDGFVLRAGVDAAGQDWSMPKRWNNVRRLMKNREERDRPGGGTAANHRPRGGSRGGSCRRHTGHQRAATSAWYCLLDAEAMSAPRPAISVEIVTARAAPPGQQPASSSSFSH
jgi:hypothetical protein